jgi:cephalosporin-C deacetylase-like acetyl esterase
MLPFWKRFFLITGWIMFFGTLIFFGLREFFTEDNVALEFYYDYDPNLPLETQLAPLPKTSFSQPFYLSYRSVNEQRVTALYSLPRIGQPPYPAVIFLHGIGDSKSRDYMQLGDSLFCQAGYAVLRIDIQYHGDRKIPEMKIDLVKNYPHASRNALVQTIFDLRRAVDFLDRQPEIDSTRTAFAGISLGGIIGTVFVGVEPRVEVPVLILAGGGLKFLFGSQALSARIRNFLAPIEPLNFAAQITGRPVLFLNASRDEIVPKATTQALFRRVGEPKQIKWYDDGHKMNPVPVLKDCVGWLDQHFKTE